MDYDAKASITELRKLRDELCKKQKHWKSVFEVKDAIVQELKDLKLFIGDPNSSKEEIIKKIEALLTLMEPQLNNAKDCNG